MPDGTNWLDIVNVAGSLTAGVATVVIAIMVQRYTRRRDRAAVVQGMWQQQQEWNLTAAGSPAHALAIEQMAMARRRRTNGKGWR